MQFILKKYRAQFEELVDKVKFNKAHFRYELTDEALVFSHIKNDLSQRIWLRDLLTVIVFQNAFLKVAKKEKLPPEQHQSFLLSFFQSDVLDYEKGLVLVHVTQWMKEESLHLDGFIDFRLRLLDDACQQKMTAIIQEAKAFQNSGSPMEDMFDMAYDRLVEAGVDLEAFEMIYLELKDDGTLKYVNPSGEEITQDSFYQLTELKLQYQVPPDDVTNAAFLESLLFLQFIIGAMDISFVNMSRLDQTIKESVIIIDFFNQLKGMGWTVELVLDTPHE